MWKHLWEKNLNNQHTEITKQAIRTKLLGNIPWNKGLKAAKPGKICK